MKRNGLGEGGNVFVMDLGVPLVDLYYNVPLNLKVVPAPLLLALIDLQLKSFDVDCSLVDTEGRLVSQ